MGKAFRCPYFDKRTNFFVMCEGECFTSFDTKEECKHYVNKYCGHNTGWLECDIAKEYERRYGMND